MSVNIMDMSWEGGIKHFIQLGTVMTEKQYRNQGFIRKIMDEIEADFAGKTDGMYLFANDSVLDFYPKFGYHKSVEFQYSKTVDAAENRTIKQISMRDKKAWKVLECAIQNSNYHPELSMCRNVDLYMFYVTNFMQENVYYDSMEDISGCNCRELHEKNTTLFLKGNIFDTFGERQIMFPAISHA